MSEPLRAGPLTALLDGIDLRYVRSHGVEAFRRIYVAVRDPDWGTIPGVVNDLHVEQRPTSFSASFVVDHRAGPIDYTWHGRIDGADDGTITYHMDGTANGPFAYNRIGFCILHPDDECAGQAYSGHGPDGPFSGRLPDHIAPQPFEDGVYVPLVGPFSSLTIDLRNDGHAAPRLRRRPLRDRGPAQLDRCVVQVVLHADGARVPPSRRGRAALRATDPSARQRPGRAAGRSRAGGQLSRCASAAAPVAACHPSDWGRQRRRARPMTRRCELLRALRPTHQRVDVHLDDPQWRCAR